MIRVGVNIDNVVMPKQEMINDDNAGTPHKKTKWFWHETWVYMNGPYDTELEAKAAMQAYKDAQ